MPMSVMSSQEKIDDSPEGQYMLGMFLGLAELYGAQVGRRWAQIAERNARRGKHHGITPAGYVTVDKRMLIDPILGPVVTDMFRAYAAGNFAKDIVERFAAARGRPILRGTVKDMLQNPIYLGRVRMTSQLSGKIEVDGEHEPLVDQATWERVQRRIAHDRVTPPRRLGPSYSLTGLIWCAHRNGPTRVWYSNEKGRVRRIICARGRQRSDGCRGIGSPLYDQIEAAMLDAIRKKAASLRDDSAARIAQLSRSRHAGIDAKTIDAELKATQTAMARITQRWGRGLMPDVAYDGAMAELLETENLLKRRLIDAEDIADAPPPGRIVGLVDEMMALWPDALPPERNRMLRSVVGRFYLRHADRWREPIPDRVVDIDWVF
jgi:site-specific DNA recombinase